MATMSYIPIYDPYQPVHTYNPKTVQDGIPQLGSSSDGLSNVIHLRSLPDDVSTKEIVDLALPFKKYGKIKNFLPLKSKNQALIEVDNLEMAKQIVTHYTMNPPAIRQRTVYVQYSNHKELKTESNPGQEKTLEELNRLQQSEGGPNHVLRVVVENMVYNVTLDVFYQIFSKFGQVLKIITFTKNNQFQALIQMADDCTTQTAKLSLDGQNIYTNCCTLRIDYSKLSSLNVKYNNEKSRDYTRQDLPFGESDSMQGMMSQSQAMHSMNPMHGHVMNGHMVNMQQQMSQNPMNPQMMTQMMSQQMNQVQMQQQQTQQPQQTVLLVSNLDPEKVSCYDLFILFGVYGNVLRVKILYNKPDNALLQMSDSQQSETALLHLNNRVMLYDRPLRIIKSKHQHVQMPKDGQEAANMTQDFTNSPLHRFKKPGSKNFQNIHPPSETLHLSNIPLEVDEQQLKSKFSDIGGTVLEFKFFPKDRRMALIKLANISEAVHALVKLHNTKLSETNHLRISFARISSITQS